MKYFLLSILFFFTLSSCTMVYFDKPVPPFGTELEEFPDLFKGSFHLDGDTLTLEGNNLKFSENWFKKIISNSILDIDLSGLIYKQDGDFLVINIPNEGEKGEIYYLILLLEMDGDKLKIRVPVEDKDYGFHYDKPIILEGGVKIILEKDKNKADKYILSPSQKDWKTIKEMILSLKAKVFHRIGT